MSEKITKEVATEIINKERAERAEKCVLEVQDVLKKYNCKIDPRFMIADGKLETSAHIKTID